MGNSLDGRVAVITGAGRGLGREHALLLAQEGAKVLVNDFGGGPDGSGGDASPAQQVVEEIRAAGGEAVANHESVSDWEAAGRIIGAAVSAFGRLDVVVNNAGILRDRMLVSLTEAEWDSVVDVHLKGTVAVMHHAAGYFRDQAKAGAEVKASIINTTSGSGLAGNAGQSNYGAAKAGIAALTVIGARELERYGVRVNAISPIARTRLTEQTPGLMDALNAMSDGSSFDEWHPGNISPLVAVLAAADCPFTGRVFEVHGGQVGLYETWHVEETFTRPHRWEVADLKDALAHVAPTMKVASPI